MNDIRRVPLDALHRQAGAKMGAFAGWDMPIQYPAGLKAEHHHTRKAASLFDVSHMGQLRVVPVDGRPATLHAQLEAALPVDFGGWPENLQKYSYLLNSAGGIEDDLMLTRLDDGVQGEARLVVNAGNREHDLQWLRARCPQLRFEWIEAALVALQGPAAEVALAALDPRATELGFMHTATLDLLGAPCFTTRSGYTGEDGFEISIPLSSSEEVVTRLLENPAVHWAGLGARDTLRLEAGLPLHGSDITPKTTPIEAGLSFAIPKSRRADGAKAGGFPGAEVILRQFAEGTRRRLVGLVSHGVVPIRAHSAIFDATGRQVGEVSSGTISPTLGHPVMLAWIERAALDNEADAPLHAVVRDRQPAVQVTPVPFVPKRYKR